MPEDWTRVFHKEIARRRDLHARKHELFSKIHVVNPKGLLRSEECNNHIWVPATHLFIHDSATNKTILNGVRTRGFQEAKPWTDDGCTVVPQMCWSCDATREREILLQTTEERLAELQASRPKKKKGKKASHIEASFDALFQFG